MASAEEIVQVIAALLAAVGEVDPAKVTPGAQLSDLGLDSVEVLEVVAQLEDHYDLSIPEEALGRISTVRELARCVERLLKSS